MELVPTWIRAQAGERDALERLFAKLRDLLNGTRHIRGLSAHDRDDVIQEVMTSVLGGIRRLPCPRNLQAYVGYRAWSSATSMRRRNSQILFPPENRGLELADVRNETPPLQLIEMERQESLRDCMGQLTAPHRECVQRRFHGGESVQAIATSMGVSHVAIHKRLAAAFRSLRTCLDCKGVAL